MSDDYPPWQERLVVAVERIADGIERIEDRLTAERLARVTAARQEAERPRDQLIRHCPTCRVIGNEHAPDCPNRPTSNCPWCNRSWMACVNYPCQGRQNQSDGSGR